MLAINGLNPLIAVDENAKITGSFQGLGTRQNSCVYAQVLDVDSPAYAGMYPTGSSRATTAVQRDGLISWVTLLSSRSR